MDIQEIYFKYNKINESHNKIDEYIYKILYKKPKMNKLNAKKKIEIPIGKFVYEIVYQNHLLKEPTISDIEEFFYRYKLNKDSIVYNLVSYLDKFFSFYEFSKEQVIYSFILTINNLLKKYTLREIYFLTVPFVNAICKSEIISMHELHTLQDDFHDLLALIIVFNNKVTQEDRIYLLTFYNSLFISYRPLEKRINIIGRDVYEKYLNEIYLYLSNDFLRTKYTDALFESFSNNYTYWNDIKKVNDCLILFARKGYILDTIPELLNETYADEYASLMLAKELKE